MKIIKFTSVVLLCLGLFVFFAPQLSAKHYKCKHRSSFGLSFNVNPRPRYVEYNYISTPSYYERVTVAAPVAAYQPVVPYQPAPAYQPVVPYQPTVAYQPYVQERVYYPSYTQQVVVERPSQSVYVRPQFSFSFFKR